MIKTVQTVTETKKQMELLKNELDIICSLYLKIREDMDLDSFLDEVIFTLRERITFDGCNIALIDEYGIMRVHKIDYSKISKKSKVSADYLKKIYSQHFNIKSDNDLACVCAREKMEIHYPEIQLADFNQTDQEFFRNYGITSLYYVPIKIEFKIIGVMRFHNYGGKMILTEFEKNLIRRRINLIARAIQNFLLYRTLHKKNEEILYDLKLAEQIHSNLFPQSPPEMEHVRIIMEYQPMICVGGDYFDFFKKDAENNELGVLLTDASGHGVSAAFITSMVKMSFTNDSIKKIIDRPDQVLSLINQSLYGKIAGNFVTGIYCYFDFTTMKLKVSSAGHPPLIYINRRSETLTLIKPSGVPLGFFPDTRYTVFEDDLRKRDRFFLYSDGLTEVCDSDGEPYELRLLEILKKGNEKTAQQLHKCILNGLNEHTSHIEGPVLKDDLAFILIDIY